MSDMKLIMETFKGKVNEKTTAPTPRVLEPLMDSIQMLQMVAKAIEEDEVSMDSGQSAGEFDQKAAKIRAMIKQFAYDFVGPMTIDSMYPGE